MIQKRRKAYSVPMRYRTTGGPATLSYKPKTGGRVGGRAKRERGIGLEPKKYKKRKRPLIKIPTLDDFETQAPRLVTMNKRREFNMTNTTYRPVDPFGVNGGLVENERDIPQRIQDGDRYEDRISDAVVPRGLHRTKVDTGHPTTKVLKGIAKENGTTTAMIYDTKAVNTANDLERDENIIRRGELDSSNGFNHKTYKFLQGIASPGYRGLMETVFGTNLNTGVNNWFNTTTAERFKDKRYMSFMWLESKVSMFNENAYLPMKVKFHMIRPLYKLDKQDSELTTTTRRNYLTDIQQNVFNQVVTINPNQTPFAIPTAYQYDTPFATGVGEEPGLAAFTDNYKRISLNVYVDNKCDLRMSSYFKANFKIEKTFTKTLQPNDTWIFTHKQHFGPGIDIDEFRAAFKDMNMTSPGSTMGTAQSGNDRPLGYIYMVEHVGVPCTAVVGDGPLINNLPTPSTYQGTSDGQIHFEYRSRAKFINSAQVNAIQIGTDGSDQLVHTRTWTTQDMNYNSYRKPRYVLPNNVVSNSANIDIDKGYIPIVTDRSIKGSDQRGLEGFLT